MNGKIVPFPTADDYFGLCLDCVQEGKTDPPICMHVDRHCWFVCDVHRVKWYEGSNLFSSWRDLLSESQELALNSWQANERLLSEYREVEPYHYPATRAKMRRAQEVIEDGAIEF